MLFIRNSNETFNRSLKELAKNSYENINKKDKKGRTILHYAVRESDPKTVRLLIKKGADVNSKDVGGYVPMHLAVMGKRLKNVKELISSGANINVVERNGKHTPLHFACMAGEVEIVKELVKAGAKTDQPDKSGKTPMDCAKNNKEIMEVLKNAKIANEQKKFIEKIESIETIRIVLENMVADVIVEREDPIEVGKWLNDMEKEL
ncbi:ankyrin repeat domain-containing protein [Candidatus Wolbachia massiliensis]|uniref:Ankyrin repeat domain-containing protein n=1 Tax=Candidatus Wolbachia massiliensis TaxID=1845000 RepID=A0A7M3U298_9RICK|nr:ankyrin repeat domain-containing protein [Candidatus Wolbachia massiliensis]QOD38533.1 ankyrin repeat domain-containing protein [Candidatus Wolbachia massiliensis]